MHSAHEKKYRLGPFEISRRNLIRLIVTDILVIIMILIPVLVAFAAEMLLGGSFLNSGDLTTYWTTLDVVPGLTVSWDAAGYADGCVRFETPVGRNNSGQAYIYQSTTGSISPTDTVRLVFRWKKNYVSSAAATQTLYVEIQKPSSAVVRIWEDTAVSNANAWTLYDQTVSSSFDEPAGVYVIRFGAELANVNDRNAQTFGWFDEVSLDATGGGDTTPPGVSITDPLDGDFVGGNYTITADATDDVAVDRVEFFYESNLIGPDSTSPYSVSWDTTGLADAGYILTATAYDTSNNSNTSSPVNVTVDNTNPTAIITDPTASQLISQASYPVIGTADDTNFLQYTLEYGAGASPASWNNIGTNPRTAPVVSGTLGTWDTSALSDGAYTIRLITTDRANNTSTDTVLVNVDTSQPTVASATAGSSTLVDVAFSEALDPATIQSGYFTIDNGIAVLGATLLGDNQTVRLDTSGQTAGLTYTVTVKATAPTVTDINGNIVGTPNTAQFTGFTSGPTSVINAPSADQFVKGTITITGTADDPDFTQYTLTFAKGKLPPDSSYEDVGTNPRTTPVNNGTLGTWDTSALSDGDYTIRLITRNAFALETTATVRVVLDDTPPVVDSARAVDATTVDVLFREHVSGGVDPAYFTIAGLTVSAAVRMQDYRTMRLTTSTQTPDANYAVTVRDTTPTVADLNGNEILSVNNSANFTGYNSLAIRGDGNLLRRHADDATCGGMTMGCHNLLIHSSDVSRDVYGTWGRTFNCKTCHEPHGTRNIYLVRETITTPNSGDKPVDFRTIGIGDPYNDPDPVPGAHDYSLADDNDGFNDSVCEVCHTQTKHFRNDGASPAPGHNSDLTCTNSACHPHTLGFPYPAKGESEGNTSCDSCHSSLFAAMNGDTEQYHHYLNNTQTTYPVIADPSTLTTNDTNKRCLMCHVDHNIFRPDINGANGGERARNLRQTIKSDVNATSNFTNSDYLSGHVDGGICLSCHTNSIAKNTTEQKSDGSTATLPIDKTQFDAAISAHNYEVTSDFPSDGTSLFHANCVKCHSDTLPKSYQSPSGNAFGTHVSWLNRILAPLGIAAPGSGDDPLEERFCYECHTGGASADGPDYYGSVTMDMNAINVKDVFASTHTHPIASTNGIHKTIEGRTLDNQPIIGWNKGANRHVECTDCHNVHAAQDGLHTVGSNIIGPTLLGQWGVKPTAWGTGGTQHTSFDIVNFNNASPGSIQYQAYLCFKCHSYYAYDTNPPNTPSGMPDGSAAVQSDVVTEFNPNNRAHHAVIQPGNHPANPNFTQTFVSPWGPGSTVQCSDCHASSSAADPGGPHGSENKWLLRGNETGVGTPEVLCYNCHSRDVYGDDGYTPPNETLSRAPHPINASHTTPSNWPKNGIWCMNCHGGSVLGGLHGTNAGTGPAGGSSPLGERFLNGAAILGFTQATTAKNSGGCWTKGTTDSVNNCTRGHSNMSWTANYDL